MLELSRWQFALTTLYHFIFVLLTLGLAPFVAIMQTLWYRKRDEKWLRLSRFGTLFLINFAIGAATGLVMEFQFGMNWSSFSSFVGDVFACRSRSRGSRSCLRVDVHRPLDLRTRPSQPEAAPRDDLPGLDRSWLSAYFIIAANSWIAAPCRLHGQ